MAINQEDKYFLELVRYIHLNPISAGLVKDLDRLGSYKYCSHSIVMGKVKNAWQDINAVLCYVWGKAEFGKAFV